MSIMSGLSFQLESYDDVIEEIEPLLKRHWEEIALYPDIKLDPNYQFYRAANQGGALLIYTARLDGVLIGYAIYFVRPSHPHYQGHGWAVSDIIMVMPEHRTVGVAYGLFNLVECDLRDRKISVMHTNTKTAHPQLAKFLEARGHAKIEISYALRLN